MPYINSPINLDILSFNDFKIGEKVLMGLTDMGFDKPTPIQEEAIPVLLDGKDILASAQTGTGKTAAFAIPLIEKISANPKPGIRALVLAPTRELAIQIDQQFWSIGYHAGISSACIYGGSDWGTQEKAIREGVDILVATPGRLIDHIKVSSVDFSALEFLVLDEADRMLDMGFLPDVRSIIHRLPKKRQSLLFSATLSGSIETLAREITQDPVRINISSFKPAEGVTQQAYKVAESGKLDLILHLVDPKTIDSAIIFVSTKRGVDGLARALQKKGVKVGSIHGDRDQKEREATLSDFSNSRINVIVATDVMARGIDVTGVSHVINYNVPRDLDDYIHRIGRTARAEKKGTAITLVSPEDGRYFSTISKEMSDRLEIVDLPEALADYAADGADGSSTRRTASPRGGSKGRSSSRSGSAGPGRGRQSRRPAPASDAGSSGQSGDNTTRATTKSNDENGNAQETSENKPTDDTKRTSRRRPPRRRKEDDAPADRTKQKSRNDDNSRDDDRRKPSSGRDSRRGSESRGGRSRSNGDTSGKKRTPVDQQQLNRIKSVTEPFGNDTKPAENKPKGGIWSKITSIFGKD